VIRSYRSKALRRFVENGDASKLGVRNVERLVIMLRHLDAARVPDQMNIAGFFFHPLKGREKGRYSCRVTGNVRLTFGWHDQDAVELDLEDYH
jgi:proteic killer suppression protein